MKLCIQLNQYQLALNPTSNDQIYQLITNQISESAMLF